MHEDERRDPGLTRKMVLEEFVSDPEELHRKYQGLAERDRRARKQLAKHGELAKSLETLEREKKDLSRRLASAHGALEAYRAETRRLKEDLKRVRGSRSMRMGLAISKSVGVLGRRRLQRDRPAVDTPETAVEESTGLGPASPSKPSIKLSEVDYEQLELSFANDPSAEALNTLLNRTWFQRGDLSACENLLAVHSDLVTGLPPKGKELVARIRGVGRMRDGRIEVPIRAHSAAYRVEAGRVMYCAHSTPVFDSNGYSTRTRGLVEGLRQSGVDISVVGRIGYPWDTHPESAPAAEQRLVTELGGVDYVHLPGANINRDPLDEYVIKAADAIVREAKIRRPAAIHAASNFRQALPALIAARRLGIPFVYEVRGLWELTEATEKEGWENSERFALQVKFETIVATEADHVLAITTQIRDELIERGVATDQVTVLPNAVNEKEFVPLPADQEYARSLGIVLNRPVIGFAGSLVRYEGLDVLLRAVREVLNRDIPLQVVIAGSGPAETSLRNLASDLGLEQHVSFVGRLSTEEIPRLMSLMDIMPCPRLSTPVTELVSPLKPLEALAAGKTVVLSDVAPQRDLIPADSGRGFLVPAGDSESLASTLATLLDETDVARAAARAGRLWVVRERTWAVLTNEVRYAHERAIAKSSAMLSAQPSRPLQAIRVGLIADEFTTATLSSRVQIFPISREDPLASIEQNLDAIFIESAWEGNDGEWTHGVGYYDDEQFAAMRKLLWGAKQRGIPTIFWNKEDPIHYRRFARVAMRCDYVFTTDASLLEEYLRAGSRTVRSASALPFYAEPTLHNPVQSPTALGTPTAMYAGSFYGDRYAARSNELTVLLRSAARYGLTIYDRQYGTPDTPYRFPEEFAGHVRGSLSYQDVLDAYRSHYINLNVNSVTSSPTMFSRRVVEAAASGGVVLSGPGRGVVETFGGAIPVASDPSLYRAFLRSWTMHPDIRFDEAWFQLRVIARAHTTETSLAIAFRTAGIPVDGMKDPTYVATVPDGSSATIESILSQSVAPVAVAVASESLSLSRKIISASNSRLPSIDIADVPDWVDTYGVDALVSFEGNASRTLAEDLLIAHRFRHDDRIVAREYTRGDDARLLAAPASELPVTDMHTRIGELTLSRGDGGGRSVDASQVPPEPEAPAELTVVLPPKRVCAEDDANVSAVSSRPSRMTVLVAGHDLKFISSYIAKLEAEGHTVLLDQWSGHSGHDEAISRELLSRADVIWCEWGLGNAVWYSRHVAPTQKLIVRVHLQEIDRPYLRRVRMDAVDSFIFVGELIRRAAVEGHGVPSDRSIVIPNVVSTSSLALPKREGAKHTLGFVGIVPQRKRVDLVVDLIEQLHLEDPRFRLRVKGKRPEEYSWMEQRPQEMQWYRSLYERIDSLNVLANDEVIGFDEHGDDMADWYRNIGTVVSTSNFESFHLTLADGAASGADAVSLAWDGADLIYPDSILFSDIGRMADGLLDPQARNRRVRDLAAVVESFDENVVFRRFSEIIWSAPVR